MGALEQSLKMIQEVDPEKTLPQCEIQVIEIGSQALASILSITKRFIPKGSVIAVVADKNIIYRDGLNAKKKLIEYVTEDYTVNFVELDDGHSELHASEEVITECVKQCAGVDGIISIGGGTITDIGKMTSVALNGIPHIVVQTAASVDGFTDNVSVIMINGVKRTVPSRWPDAVIADTTLIAAAPPLMNKAGYGEINSMFTAPADWRIAAILGFEKNFHWGPIKLLRGVGEGIEQWSPGLKNSDVVSTEKLVCALAVRGIVTGVADTTACLSGIEHLVSHMLDMNQAAKHARVGQHGAQVGVGSLIAASVWELIFHKFANNSILINHQVNTDDLHEKVTEAFKHLDESGKLAIECWSDYGKKVQFWKENLLNIERELQHWQIHASELRLLIKTPEEIIEGLVSAGSPGTFDELDPTFDEDVARWAVANCHFMRNRFTGIDLLQFLGLWDAEAVDWVFERCRQAFLTKLTNGVLR